MVLEDNVIVIPAKTIEHIVSCRAKFWSEMMSEEKIYVDASQPATLNNGGVLNDCPTLQEAVMAWHRLPPEQKKRATIRVMGGPLYSANEIERLHYGSKPRS